MTISNPSGATSSGPFRLSISGSTLSELMKKIKKITGRLIINANDGLDIDFPELETVDASKQSGKQLFSQRKQRFSAEAIVINGNKKVKSLKFPKLKTVLTDGANAIDVKGFDVESVTKEQAGIMAKAADKKTFKFG